MTTSKLHFPNEGCFTQDALRCISHVTSLSREADCSSVSKTSREVELISCDLTAAALNVAATFEKQL